jgi:hypothetical protein
MKPALRFALVAAGVLAVVSVLVVAASFPLRLVFEGFAGSARTLAVTQGDIQSVLDWATKQGVKPGMVRHARLPAGFAAFGQDNAVDIVRLKDGRTCFLLKTHIGYKDNFEGVLACTAPLLHGELVAAQGTYPAYVSLTACALPGCGVFEELYIRRTRDPRTFDVAFDLN